jgi:hypothetical protein
VHIVTGKGGYFFSSTENTVIIFHLVSIVKYNNIICRYNIVIISFALLSSGIMAAADRFESSSDIDIQAILADKNCKSTKKINKSGFIM